MKEQFNIGDIVRCDGEYHLHGEMFWANSVYEIAEDDVEEMNENSSHFTLIISKQELIEVQNKRK